MANLDALTALVVKWREEARFIESLPPVSDADRDQADRLRQCAADLEAVIHHRQTKGPNRMATLDVVVLAQTGQPVANELVTINTFDAHDWAKPGIEINPNPRRTGPDGWVNFYSGPPLGGEIRVQATAQNGTSDPVGFDGTADVLVTVTLIPFE
jgi:hypothetical protein